jgi:aminoglycoside 3-N-acetyltransferase
MHKNDMAAVEDLLDILVDAAGSRSILMPSFTRGFVDGVCNLDIENSSTGVLSECFRKRPGVRRTLSAFFPFTVKGPVIDEVINLKPEYAWGEGSIYEWMEKRDVCFLMFGTHPTHCSYLHRLEWLARDAINYRFDKVFRGQLIREGVVMDFVETLYVRKLDPPVVNDFAVLLPFLVSMGMKLEKPRGLSISSYHAKELLAQVLPVIRRDPFFTVKNKKDY